MTILNRLRVFGFGTIALAHVTLVFILPEYYMDMVLISLGVNAVCFLVVAPILAPFLILKDMQQIEGFVECIKKGQFGVSLPVGLKAFGDVNNSDVNEFDRLRVSLNWMARQIALREERIQAQRDEAIAIQKKLEDTVIRDPLTNIFNRQYFRDQIAKALSSLFRHHRPFALALLDVDFFKKINDTHGHLTGDKVLVRLATLLQATVRDGDSVARVGGEEFAVLLNDIHECDVALFLDRVQTAIRAETFTAIDGQPVPVTVSMGYVAAAMPAEITQDDLIRQADEALYFVKRNGRDGIMNWVELAQTTPRGCLA